MEPIQASSTTRGRITQNGVVIEPCSINYLHQLAIEMFRAMARPFVCVVRDTNEDDDEERLEMITYELERLLNNPALFPSDPVRAKFLALMALDSELQFQEACGGLIIEAEIQELDAVRRQDYARPLYQPGTKGWENFLLNMAPGAPEDPTNRSITSPVSALQMIPAVGLKILADFEREEQDIVKYIEQAPGNYLVQPARTTLMIDFDTPTPWEERIPRRVLTQRTERLTVRPNPFKTGRSVKDDISKYHDCEIDYISGFLHDIEAPQAAPGTLTSTDVFPAFTIRQWHPPTKFLNLRFQQLDG